MKQTQIEIVGKVFVVVRGGRRCLICDGVFKPREAADHAVTLCYPRTEEVEEDAGTLDPCSPFRPLIASSS